MKIISLECSAIPCSAAVLIDGEVAAYEFSAEKITHSQTLMPRVKAVTEKAGIKISEADCFAVSAGPGSFTGVRIGISAVKGMAAAKKIPCAAVSTLRCMAENYNDTDCVVCAVMDARCNQVYNALFSVENGKIQRLCEDRALLCDELVPEIKTIAESGKNVIIVGDGAEVFYPFVENISGVELSSEDRRYQNAVGVVLAAKELIENNKLLSPEELQPVYLRLPQAERELKRKKENEK